MFDINQYSPVSRRLKAFHAKHPEGRIQTSIVTVDREFVVIRAELYRQPDDASPYSVGHASEVAGSSQVNKKFHVENCETSAIGRALSNAGFDAGRQETNGHGIAEETTDVERYRVGVFTVAVTNGKAVCDCRAKNGCPHVKQALEQALEAA